jgi:3-amino-4-hydroxybenzoic acid synthase
VWFDARDIDDSENIIQYVFNSYIDYMLIDIRTYGRINPPKKMKLIVEITDIGDIGIVGNDNIVLSEDSELLNKAKENGYKTAYFKKITSQEDMDLAWETGLTSDFLVVELLEDTNIPLELIIARLQNSSTSLLKKVSSVEEAKIAFGVMEKGSDGVLIRNNKIHELINMNGYLKEDECGHLEMATCKVTEVEHIGMGYRACVDTTDLFTEKEGMIVGSTSSGGLLVSSETHYLPYMELRPFRVNAGAVHSYTWAPNGMLAYLTELKAGKKVLSVDTEGNTKEVSVGRVKIEMRPLLKIEAEANGVIINTIVQDDWHIRIFGSKGEVRNASTIKEGDELLGYVCSGGRHVGIKIDESICEK